MKSQPYFIAIFLFLMTFTLPQKGFAGDVIDNLINGHFELKLPHDDAGTIYFNQDKSVFLIPSFDNTFYVHNCWAHWSFKESEQKLTITDARKCKAINGIYKISREGNFIILKDHDKTIVLKPFMLK